VWDTDVMRPLIDAAASATGRTYTSSYESDDDLSLRILAEHARSGAMLVADGVFPSNEGRGYVLRRILRRAIRHAYRLGTEKLIMPGLVETAVAVMGDAYPDLRAKGDFVQGVISREEERFRQTLKSGNAILEIEFDGLTESQPLTGSVAFQLHDTFGFPIELTTEIAAERNRAVDLAGFEAAMTEQQERARAARKVATTPEEVADRYRAITLANGTTEFIGYTETTTEATVVGVVEREDGTVEVYLDRSPFYAESGGQVGDTGTLTSLDGVVEVLDSTFAIPGLIRHVAKVVSGTIEEGTTVTATIDVARRNATRRNHTGTHLLHWALKEVLGDHVKQQGSLVGPDRLRFDFAHFDAVTPEQITRIEDLVNEVVLTAAATENPVMAKADAESLGAVAFFGDKYGDTVRILRAGPTLEFCGGTHVANVGQIGAIKVISESSIGANVRRIEASTGLNTLQRLRSEVSRVDGAAALLKAKPEEISERIAKLIEERKDLERQVESLHRAAVVGQAGDLVAKAVNGTVVERVDGLSRDSLRDLAVAVRDKGVGGVVLIGVSDTGGVTLVSAATKASGFDAGALIADAAKAVGGGGGKGADLAVAGGRNPEAIDKAIELARTAAGR
jgi:alanyl-tRNA synthetase